MAVDSMARIRWVLAFLGASLLLALPALALTAEAPPEKKAEASKDANVLKDVSVTHGNFEIQKGCEGMKGFTPCHRQMTSWSPTRADVSE